VVRFAFRQLQAAKEKKREAEFQFDVAISELRAAEKAVDEAKQTFAEATDYLFDQTPVEQREAA
jgi:hypothetical protein